MVDFKGRRVLVTGAAGFIGTNLIEALTRRNAEIHALIRPTTYAWRLAHLKSMINIHYADIVDDVALRRILTGIKPHIIYHLASPGGHPADEKARKESLLTNGVGTLNILETAKSVGYERLIYIGSSLEYSRRSYPLKETDSLEPVTFRGVSKAVASLLCEHFLLAYNQPIVILRPFSVYGYWEQPWRFIPTAIKAFIYRGEIPLVGGDYKHDFIFIEDFIDASLLAGYEKRAIGEIFNVGSGRQWSNEEVVKILSDIFGYEIPVRKGAYPSRPFDTEHWVADISKAKTILNWQPRYSLTEGLKRTAEWRRNHMALYPEQDLF